MKRKAFFQERTDGEKKKLHTKVAYYQRNLVQLIDDLDPSEDALQIRVKIVPGKFFRKRNTGKRASSICYKHGDLIALPQDEGLTNTHNDYGVTPLDLRIAAFEELKGMRQEEINFVGYSWRPVFGRDRTKRIVHFVNIPEGARIFTYAENFSVYEQLNSDTQNKEGKLGIKVEAYPDAAIVRIEGARVVIEVPSRTKKRPKYKFGMAHVPFTPNPFSGENYNLAISLSLKPTSKRDEELDEPIVGTTEFQNYDIQYESRDSRKDSDVLRFSPQEITGYIGVINKQMVEMNQTALTFNPFALPSKHQAEFYTKLNNNVLIFDPTLSNKDKLRKPHLAEKSILLARAIGHFGHEDFAFWDPVRDGIFKNYSW